MQGHKMIKIMKGQIAKEGEEPDPVEMRRFFQCIHSSMMELSTQQQNV